MAHRSRTSRLMRCAYGPVEDAKEKAGQGHMMNWRTRRGLEARRVVLVLRLHPERRGWHHQRMVSWR